jgi:hypothetical protein
VYFSVTGEWRETRGRGHRRVRRREGEGIGGSGHRRVRRREGEGIGGSGGERERA